MTVTVEELSKGQGQLILQGHKLLQITTAFCQLMDDKCRTSQHAVKAIEAHCIAFVQKVPMAALDFTIVSMELQNAIREIPPNEIDNERLPVGLWGRYVDKLCALGAAIHEGGSQLFAEENSAVNFTRLCELFGPEWAIGISKLCFAEASLSQSIKELVDMIEIYTASQPKGTGQ